MSEKSKKKKAKAEPTPETEQTVPETEAVEEAVKPEAEEPKKEEKPAEEPKAKTEKEPKAIFGGRLGEYKYYDMDQVIAAALEKAEEIL